MNLTWIDYPAEYAETIESWMDEEAVRGTGCDAGWFDFVKCCMEEPGTIPGENFWFKIVLADGVPVAVIAAGEENGNLQISEFLVDPKNRGQGIGSGVLAVLLRDTEQILGKNIRSAGAVIFPDNLPSQKAFEKAGFIYESTHPDGDAWYYRWYR